MDTVTLLSLLATCAPQVHASTAQALVQVESAGNPWAIGVVGGALLRQPGHRAEALATARARRDQGWNFSVGLAQINVGNFQALGLTLATAFKPCTNLAAMQTLLADCYARARAAGPDRTRPVPPQTALRRALSCYYSGNFATGFTHGYVNRVVAAASAQSHPANRTTRLPNAFFKDPP